VGRKRKAEERANHQNSIGVLKFNSKTQDVLSKPPYCWESKKITRKSEPDYQNSIGIALESQNLRHFNDKLF